MPLEHLKTKVCIDCICLPTCVSKTKYDLINSCQILKNALWDIVYPLEKPHIVTEYQIGLDLVNIDGTGKQVIVEKRMNHNGTYETYARIGTYATDGERKLRITKILKSERINGR